MGKRIFTLIIAAAMMIGSLSAQSKWALKTNVLHDATGSVNLAAEYAFMPKWSAEVSTSLNLWKLESGFVLKHVFVQPGVRYWFKDNFAGLFVGGNLLGGFIPEVGRFWDLSKIHPKMPNLKSFYLRDAFSIGAGASIGYAYELSRHWNLEVELGLGYLYTKGDEYSDDVLILKGSEFDYIGPTKLAFTVLYMF